MKNRERSKWTALARQGLAMLLVTVLLVGYLLPNGAMATEEETEPTVETTVPETTAAAEETKATEPEVTTAPTQTQSEETKATEPEAAPTETQPKETKATEPEETEVPTEPEATAAPTEPEKTAYEKVMADLTAMEEEAKTLEAMLEVLNAFFSDRLMACWDAAQLQWEKNEISDDEMNAINEKAQAIVNYLKDEYGYENGTIETNSITRYGSSENPMSADTMSVPSLGSGSGITFRIFNYTNGVDASGNYVQAGGINDNGLYGYFNFRGTSYDNTDANGNVIGSGANASCDVDGFPATHATVEKVLKNGYPVYDAKRADASGAHNLSLGYLFGAGGKGVTNYAAKNTPLQFKADSGTYYYDSALNAVDYDTRTNNFIVRTYTERGKTTGSFGTGYADFFPFTYWNGQTKGNADKDTWYNFENTQEADYWYGMTMEATFSMTKDGQVEIKDASGNVTDTTDMVFEFSGDDDVWVFIDDVLVLDLGGTHGVVSGSINFATGQVLQYLDWRGANSTEKERTEGSTTSFPTTIEAQFNAAGKQPNGGWSENENATYGKVFKEYTEHTIKFFYLERATSCANCKISFNMPILPTGEVVIDKKVEGIQTALTQETEYEFVLYNADGTVAKNVNYAVSNVNDATGAQIPGKTTEEGKFYLKADERATFGLTAGKTFYVKETDTGLYTEAYECKLNGVVTSSPDSSGNFYIDPDQDIEVEFTNKLETTRFSVSKNVTGNLGDQTKKFTFSAKLYTASAGTLISFPAPEAGETGYTVDATGAATFTLNHGDFIEFDDIPMGAHVVVTETDYTTEQTGKYKTSYKVNGASAVEGLSAVLDTVVLPTADVPNTVEFINHKDVVIDTGVTLDSLPYVLILVCIVAAGVVLVMGKRRRYGED